MKCHQSEIEIETLYNRINSQELNLQPDFQRGEVWADNKKKKLIDSILREWKIPPIHVIQTDDYLDEVLDGQQRLAAIRDFINNEFSIDGNIAPLNSSIQKLDKLTYSKLPPEIQRKIMHYSVILIRLTEYKPAEPAELFFRLNQPTKLTSAEQRNAFIGRPRDQVKQLSKFFEKQGANKELLGFSNSRMSYDEIISKLCYSIEYKNISRKITSTQMSTQYRDDIPFSDETISIVKNILEKLVICIKQIKEIKITFSKASIYSWMLFIKTNNINIDELSKTIAIFEFSRAYIKGLIEKNNNEAFINECNILKERYSYYEVLLNIYNQRASMGSTDGLAIVQRDFILNLFYRMIFDTQSELLVEFINLTEKKNNLPDCLESMIKKYQWGEKF